MIETTDLTEIRRYLHQHPELSGKEYNTQKVLLDFIVKNCPSARITRMDKTGFITCFPGEESSKIVMLRSELDALPISETNTFEHKSTVAEVSHKCGHDGHMTILIAVALELERKPPLRTTYLLFQPAEETGEGAEKVLNDPNFQQLQQPDAVYALHNLPGAPLHSIHIKDAEITPSVISVTLDLHGKTAHAAEPQKGLNPTYLISELQVKLKKICQLDPSKGGFQIITPIFTNIGSPDFGISAGNGRVGFTLRTTTNEAMELLKQEFVSVVERLSDSYKIPYSIQWTQAFRANKNAPLAANAIRWAAKEHNLKLIERDAPFPWGEDFGIFTEQFPGALFGLGAGEDQPALHNPDYDFPDELIDTGKRMFLSLIEGEIE